MIITLNLVAKIDPVALYAAVISTIVLTWQVFTWLHSGARLRGSVSGNMQTLGGVVDGNTYLLVNVANRGARATTITHVTMTSYSGLLAQCLSKLYSVKLIRLALVKPLRKKVAAYLNTNVKQFIANGDLPAYPIPYVIEPGQKFMAMVRQTEQLEQMSRDTRLYVSVIHATSDWDLVMRVDPIEATPTTTPDGQSHS